MTPVCLLRAMCLTVTVLSCWCPAKVSARLRIHQTDTSETRHRLSRLLAVAARLQEHGTMGVQKRFTAADDKYSDIQQDAKASLPREVGGPLVAGSEKSKQLPRVNQHYRVLRRRRQASAMDNMNQSYRMFLDQLIPFLKDVTDRLSPDAPAELQYISLIPAVLPPDDHDFLYGRTEDVIRKSRLVLKLTKLVLAAAGNYFDTDDDIQWLMGKQGEMAVWFTVVEVAISGLSVSPDDEPISGLLSGVGGIYPALPGASPEQQQQDLSNLRSAIEILQQHI